MAQAALRVQQPREPTIPAESDQWFIASFVSAIRSAFPSCPTAEAKQIADHACQRYNGRIGRTAAAKALDPEAVRLAVIAHIRHTHTRYDRLLNGLRDRRDARDDVREEVNTVLSQWT
jgi:hypothetical protein